MITWWGGRLLFVEKVWCQEKAGNSDSHPRSDAQFSVVRLWGRKEPGAQEKWQNTRGAEWVLVVAELGREKAGRRAGRWICHVYFILGVVGSH